MIQTMQSELFRIRKNRLFWVCLALAAFFVFALALTFYHNSVNGMLPAISLVSFFFVFALALTFYHNSVNGMLPAISLVSFTEFLFSDYSLIFPLTLFLCLYFTEDFHTGTYSIALSKGTSRVHLFFGKLLASWIGVLFFLFVCFGVAYLSILIMGASRYDIDYSFSAIGAFLLLQCLCKYWVVGLSHSLQINTFGENLMPILITLVVYLFLPTAVSFSLFQRLDLRGLERR